AVPPVVSIVTGILGAGGTAIPLPPVPPGLSGHSRQFQFEVLETGANGVMHRLARRPEDGNGSIAFPASAPLYPDPRLRKVWLVLRKNCPCASCLEERSKPADPFRVLTPEEVAAGAPQPVAMRPVGHYAYQITWNDGHDTGIYTLEQLRALSTPTNPGEPGARATG